MSYVPPMIKPITGKHVLIAFVLFFGVIIAVNATMITLGAKSFPGEDAKKSYLQGLKYNETLVSRQHARDLGWQASVRADRATGAVVVDLRDRQGQPLASGQLSGLLRHPTNANRDVVLVFQPEAAGRYRVTGVALTPGRWDIDLRIAAAGGDVDMRQHLWID